MCVGKNSWSMTQAQTPSVNLLFILVRDGRSFPLISFRRVSRTDSREHT